MSENTEQQPVADAQAPVGQPDLAAQVEQLKTKNFELIGEKQRVKAQFDDLQQQIAELQQQNAKQKQAKLAEAGEFQQLWKEASETNKALQQQIAELQQQLEQKDAAYQQQTIQARAVSAFQQAGVVQSDHMYALLKDRLRLKDGAVVALDGGVETDLSQFLSNLKSPESQFAYMFKGSGARGMGAVGTANRSASGTANPYLAKNFTEIIRLETENPELAARLKAEAS
jgi:DNA repair exonuclease SbcCD ATPase subunit